MPPTGRFDGLLVVDKPAGMTSRDVVNKVARWFPRGTRIGHAGTLDPLATGVLVHCIGQATRLTEYVQDMDKTYRTRLVLGAHSDTDDAEGPIVPATVDRPPDRDAVAHCLAAFIGEIDQVPPVFSAAKIEGRRAYDLARQGQGVRPEARRVRIYGVDLLAYDYPSLDLEIRCGKGTYIRSLARDLGDTLGCGAYVLTLRRTRVGPFDEKDAVALECDASAARAWMLPLTAAVANLAAVQLSREALGRLWHGQPVPAAANVLAGEGERAEVALLDPHGQLAGVGAVDLQKRLIRPLKMLS
jgi:tRNA pseudouridine55 synthase